MEASSQQGSDLSRRYPISVVIPCHNAVRELKLCLEALLENDLHNVEIIVVDDGSRDSTAQVVKDYTQTAEADLPIRYFALRQKSGPAVARNKGVMQSRHPFILFLDADIVLTRQSITLIRKSLDLYSHRSDIAGVLGSYAEIIPHDDFLTNFKNLSICFLYKSTDTLSPFVHTPICCIRREILNDAGGFDPELKTAEDFCLGIKLGTQGFRFVIDRCLEGTHLKTHSLLDILKEDWRRIRDLSTIKLNRSQRRFALRAHRHHRLISLVLPVPIMLGLFLAAYGPVYGKIALLGFVIFCLCNLSFLLYLKKQRGLGFAVKSIGCLFFEMAWGGIALSSSVFMSVGSWSRKRINL
ncbi:MAG: glycosyltransferase family 2 protein [Acidobacteriota bacterium]|nr:glycosyltransferase family 2 protein [Acidobacteriota bacterium]